MNTSIWVSPTKGYRQGLVFFLPAESICCIFLSRTLLLSINQRYRMPQGAVAQNPISSVREIISGILTGAQIRQQHLTFINAQEMSDIIMIMVLIIITAFCRISISCRVLAHHPLGSRKQFIAPILSCLIFCFRIVILSQPADITLIGKPAVAGIPIKRPRKGIIRCHYLWITMLQIRSKPRQESLMAAAIWEAYTDASAKITLLLE